MGDLKELSAELSISKLTGDLAKNYLYRKNDLSPTPKLDGYKFNLLNTIIQVKNSILWVRCGSGNVWNNLSPCWYEQARIPLEFPSTLCPPALSLYHLEETNNANKII